jgi:hypothetical protein
MNYKHLLRKLNQYSIWIFVAGLVFYFAVYLINGEKGIIDVDDNLDSEIPWRLLPKESGTLFSISNDTEVPQIMNGLKRNSLNASAFNVTTLFFYFFTPFYAYTFSFILIKIIAFFGIFLLSSNYVLKEFEDQRFLMSSILAFTFVLLPQDTIFGIAVLGLPMLIYCILNILNRKYVIASYLFVVIYPFYSSLVLGGYAVLLLLLFAAVYLIANKEKRKGFSLLKISFLMGFLYLFAEINLINQFLFDKEFVSHRTEWKASFDWLAWNADGITFTEALYRIGDFFINGYLFRRSHHLFILILLVSLTLFYSKQILRDQYILVTLVIIIIISVISGLYYWNLPVWVSLKEKIMLLRTFRFDRIYFLAPAFWYLLLLFVVRFALSRKNKAIIGLTYLLVIMNIFYVFNKEYGDFKSNLFILLSDKKHSMITYEKFYAEDLFQKINSDINKPQNSYRVVSLGVWPAVPQYNGFYTLDSYQNNYSLEYKHQFRKIIARELDKSERWKQQFDDWGSECLIFSAELDDIWGYFITNDRSVKNLELNTNVLYNMGGRYVFSAVIIENHDQLNLRFLNSYSDESTPIKIYLYEVLQPTKDSSAKPHNNL